jgi:hypothetical protein
VGGGGGSLCPIRVKKRGAGRHLPPPPLTRARARPRRPSPHGVPRHGRPAGQPAGSARAEEAPAHHELPDSRCEERAQVRAAAAGRRWRRRCRGAAARPPCAQRPRPGQRCGRPCPRRSLSTGNRPVRPWGRTGAGPGAGRRRRHARNTQQREGAHTRARVPFAEQAKRELTAPGGASCPSPSLPPRIGGAGLRRPRRPPRQARARALGVGHAGGRFAGWAGMRRRRAGGWRKEGREGARAGPTPTFCPSSERGAGAREALSLSPSPPRPA